MAVILAASGEALGAPRTLGWLAAGLGWLLPGLAPETLHALHLALRKLGHVVEYGLLGALWLRALAPDRSPAAAARLAVMLSAAGAVLDEARQGLAPGRSPAAADALLDVAGAALAVATLHGGRARARARALGGGLALALAGTTLGAAALDAALGRPAWDLGLAAAALAGLGLALRRAPRRGGGA
jgi:VanZ family protein